MVEVPKELTKLHHQKVAIEEDVTAKEEHVAILKRNIDIEQQVAVAGLAEVSGRLDSAIESTPRPSMQSSGAAK